MSKTFHITNGTSLSNYLTKLKIADATNLMTWQETLSVGPTVEKLNSKKFHKVRSKFFKSFYDIELNTNEIIEEFAKLDNLDDYSEIILWFEFDLFCHINMVAVISLLAEKKVQLPLYLVCSGRIKGEKGLKGLSELNPKQLQQHFFDKVKLTIDDIAFAKRIWKIYCGNNHNLFIPLITSESSFKYISICLKAHIKRFPDTRSGISTLEYNILELIKKDTIKSKRHLLGYALHYQGYYGYGDLQLERMINLLSIFYTEENNKLSLNRKGHLALEHQHNYQKEMNNTVVYGGVKCLDFKFDKLRNKLVKNL